MSTKYLRPTRTAPDPPRVSQTKSNMESTQSQKPKVKSLHVDKIDETLLEADHTYQREGKTTHDSCTGESKDSWSKIKEMEKKLKELDDENTKLLSERSRWIDSMSAAMNKELAKDESDLENISNRNRPMKILEEYQLMCSAAWLDAKCVLDDLDGNVDDSLHCPTLERILMICYARAEESLNEAKTKLNHLLISAPFGNRMSDRSTQCAVGDSGGMIDGLRSLFASSKSSKNGRNKTEIYAYHKKDLSTVASHDSEAEDWLVSTLKSRCDHVSYETEALEISKEVFKYKHNNGFEDLHMDSLIFHKDILQYIAKCLELSWKMVLQKPAMSFSWEPAPGNVITEEAHELHFGSANPAESEAVIFYYIHPALMHGERRMCKARVFLKCPT